MRPSNRDVWNDRWRGRKDPVNAFAKSVVRRCGSGKGRKLLDIGCGNGEDSLFFVRHGYQVAATDFSSSGIDSLRSMMRERGLVADARLHDTAKKLPFPDATFDIVYAHLSLHYFDDHTTRKIFRDIRRILRRGGILFVKCKSVDDPLYGKGERIGPDMYHLGHTRHFFRKDYLRSLLAEFDVLSLRSSRSAYHGKQSAFVAGVGKK